ncbi:MAG TPA: hypothetical protein DCP08_09720 [Chloroflexi bacterium]|nr:hypothetical protein [Chloroflexota bacterium]
MSIHNTVLVTVALATGAVLLMIGCAAPPETGGNLINVVKEAGLSDTVEIEIAELAGDAELGYLHRVTITDSQILDQIIAALNQDLQLGPRARCPARYELRFHLGDGTVQEFSYSCDNGPSFLHGGQDFWQVQDIQPPARFDELILEALASTE